MTSLSIWRKPSASDIPALVDAMMASSEEAAVEKLKEQCGGNEEVAKMLYAYQKKERLSKLGEKKVESLRSKRRDDKKARAGSASGYARAGIH